MTERLSITLEKEHIRIVERHAKKAGIKAFSTALQSLIHQFDQLQKTTTAQPEPAAEDRAPSAAA